MVLSARELNRATLARQLLLHREPRSVVDAVRRSVALQAQEPASPYIALWNRVAAFDPADLDAAFASGTLVKATLMRITLHAVAADEHPPFRLAMQRTLRASRLGDPRFSEGGLSIADLDALVEPLVAFAAAPRSKTELETWVGERLGRPAHPGLWWALRTVAPLVHAPTGGPWSFGTRPAYVASPAPGGMVPPGTSMDEDAALEHLVRRYLEGFGPASVQDVAQFALVPVSRVRQAVGSMRGELDVHRHEDGDAELYDVSGGVVPPADIPAPPRLMAMWDSVLLAYADRSRIIPPEYRPVVIRRNGDVLPTLLVDGYVAGVWRPTGAGIEATAFHPLPADAWAGLEAEAHALAALLDGRDPAAYGRYGRWWADLPGVQVRTIGR
jgi:hypothetical protein